MVAVQPRDELVLTMVGFYERVIGRVVVDVVAVHLGLGDAVSSEHFDANSLPSVTVASASSRYTAILTTCIWNKEVNMIRTIASFIASKVGTSWNTAELCSFLRHQNSITGEAPAGFIKQPSIENNTTHKHGVALDISSSRSSAILFYSLNGKSSAIALIRLNHI